MDLRRALAAVFLLAGAALLAAEPNPAPPPVAPPPASPPVEPPGAEPAQNPAQDPKPLTPAEKRKSEEERRREAERARREKEQADRERRKAQEGAFKAAIVDFQKKYAAAKAAGDKGQEVRLLVDALKDLDPPFQENLSRVLSSSIYPQDLPEVKLAVLECLGRMKVKSSLSFLGNEVRVNPDPSVRAGAVRAVTEAGDRDALPFVHDALRDRDPGVVLAAVDAALKIDSAGSLRPLLNAVPRLADNCQNIHNGIEIWGPALNANLNALQKMTGQQFGYDDQTVNKWNQWFYANQATFKTAREKAEAEAEAARKAEAEAKKKAEAEAKRQEELRRKGAPPEKPKPPAPPPDPSIPAIVPPP